MCVLFPPLCAKVIGYRFACTSARGGHNHIPFKERIAVLVPQHYGDEEKGAHCLSVGGGVFVQLTAPAVPVPPAPLVPGVPAGVVPTAGVPLPVLPLAAPLPPLAPGQLLVLVVGVVTVAVELCAATAL